MHNQNAQPVPHSWLWRDAILASRWQFSWLIMLAIGGLTHAGVPTTGGNGNLAPCAFPFVYAKEEYTDCIPTHNGNSWCSTTANYDIDRTWGNCPTKVNSTIKNRQKHSEEGEVARVPTKGGNGNTRPCVFPFILEGTEYTDCIPTRPGFSWCSTTANYDTDHMWGFCPKGRMTGKGKNKNRQKHSKEGERDETVPTRGGNGNMQPCVFPFLLEGVEYKDCIPTRPGFSWCSTTANYDTAHMWGYCPKGRMTGKGKSKTRQKHAEKGEEDAIEDGSFGLGGLVESKLTQLIQKGQQHMSEVAHKAVDDLSKKQLQSFLGLSKQAYAKAEKLAKEKASEVAQKIRKTYKAKLAEAKVEVSNAGKAAKETLEQGKIKLVEVSKQAKAKFQQKMDAGTHMANVLKARLEEQMNTLASTEEEAKLEFTAQLSKLISEAKTKAVNETTMLKTLLARVQEGLNSVAEDSDTDTSEATGRTAAGHTTLATTVVVEENNACKDQPCLNGACKVTAMGGYICICLEGYKGRLCEVLAGAGVDTQQPVMDNLLKAVLGQAPDNVDGFADDLAAGAQRPAIGSNSNQSEETMTSDPMVEPSIIVVAKPGNEENDTPENLEGRSPSEHPVDEAKMLVRRAERLRYKNMLYAALGTIGIIGLIVGLVCFTAGVINRRRAGAVSSSTVSSPRLSSILSSQAATAGTDSTDERSRLLSSEDSPAAYPVDYPIVLKIEDPENASKHSHKHSEHKHKDKEHKHKEHKHKKSKSK